MNNEKKNYFIVRKYQDKTYLVEVFLYDDNNDWVFTKEKAEELLEKAIKENELPEVTFSLYNYETSKNKYNEVRKFEIEMTKDTIWRDEEKKREFLNKLRNYIP